MDWTPIIIAIVGALGAGGLGAAIVNGLFNRTKLLADIFEKRLKAMGDRSIALESRVDKLEGIIHTLRLEIEERDDMIDTLQRENKKLIKENDCKDRKIKKLQEQVSALQSQVAILTARLDAMNIENGDGRPR